MEVPVLLCYLIQAIKLEKECYCLRKIMAYNEEQKREPRVLPSPPRYLPPPAPLPPPAKPKKQVIQPLVNDNPAEARETSLNVLSWAAIPIAIAAVCVGMYTAMELQRNFFSAFFLILLIPAGAVFLIAYSISLKGLNDKTDKETEQRRRQEDSRYADAYKLYRAALTQYMQESRESTERQSQRRCEIQERYERELRSVREYNRQAEAANKMIEELQKSLAASLLMLKTVLEAVYEMEIIYPKYRNIIALTSFYEYLDSGRCDALEGAHGAYNILELELRLDRIIYELDRVNANLAQVQKNQYKLFCEIRSANENILHLTGGIQQEIDNIVRRQDVLYAGVSQVDGHTAALSAQLNGYTTQVNTMNRDVQKYLTELKTELKSQSRR